MLSKEDKLEILNRILQSKGFKNSPSSSVLLKFLVNSTLEDVDIKESVIGLHIFGEKYDGEKSNARVRVGVYHLRKKLANYYNSDGKEELYTLQINKGQYSVSFTKQNNRANTIGKRISVKYILGILIAIALGYLISAIKIAPDLWKDFFNNNTETVLYVGDVFGYRTKTITGKMGWERDYSINSEEDLRACLDTVPVIDKNIDPVPYTYTTIMSAHATNNLSRFFSEFNTKLSVRRVSDLNLNDIKEKNLIYIGIVKNHNKLVDLVCEKNPNFSVKNNAFYYSLPDSLLNKSAIKQADGRTQEPALVSRMQGTNGTEQFFFFSDHDIGVRATVEYFTNSDSLKAFSKKHLNGGKYFTALFYVEGDERINLNSDLIYVGVE